MKKKKQGLPRVVSREEWRVARESLVAKEKGRHPSARRFECKEPPAANGQDREELRLRRSGRQS